MRAAITETRLGYDAPHMDSRWVALALIFITRTSMGFQFQSIGSVGPLLVADLGLTYAQLGTLIGLYLLPGVALALVGGMIGQRIGDRRAVVVSLAVMVVGGLLTAWSAGFAGAAAGRLLGGAGAVLMNILLVKITADWFDGREMAGDRDVVADIAARGRGDGGARPRDHGDAVPRCADARGARRAQRARHA
jgi:MFS family permease